MIPNGHVAFRNGAIYFVDAITQVVRRVDLATEMETVVAGNGGYDQYFNGDISGDGGLAVDAELGSIWYSAFDSAGDLYFGDLINGRLRKVDANGIITTVAGNGGQGSSGDGGSATQAQVTPYGMIFDELGNLYISTFWSAIRKVDPNGIISTVADQPHNGLQAPEGLTLNSLGDLYFADRALNTVFKLDRSGNVTAVDTVNGPADVAFDAAGNMYVAVQGDNNIIKIDSIGTVTVVAGSPIGTAGYSGDGGLASSALLSYPSGVGFDDVGNLYISDNDNARIRKVDLNGIITTVAGNGRSRYSGDGGSASAAQMGVPHKLAFDSAGNMFITIFNLYDIAGAAVRKVDTDGCISTDVTAGIGESGCGNGPPVQAPLGVPTGVAFDHAGNLYLADWAAARVFRIDANGSVTPIAGTGTSGYNGDNMPATQAQLSVPDSLAFDPAGNLYIADYANNRIRKVDTNGTITTVAGNGQAGTLGDGLPAIAAELNGPRGISFDAAGNLYIADSNNNEIRKVDATASTDGTHHISTVAGMAGVNNTSGGYNGDGIPATSARLFGPVGVTPDAAGNLYIADTMNERIRKVDASGIITTVAGRGGRPGGDPWAGDGAFTGDGGPATSAYLAWPYDIAFDAAGDLYFSDSHNYRVRKVTLVQPVQLKGVVSRKTHGTAGTFDIDLTNGNGIECRSGGATGNYTLVFTFSNPLTIVGSASVTSGTGSIVSSSVDSRDAHNYIVNLTGVTNAQYLTVSLTNVHDSTGNGSNLISTTMRMLVGDTNADRFVNSADIGQTKSQSGQPVDGTNFREDVNADGFINSADIGLVKSKSGTALP